MRELLNKGKGSHYSAKRLHATTKDIEEFGFVPKTIDDESGAPASGKPPQAITIAPLTENKRPPGSGTKTLPPKEAAAEEESRPRRWWRLW